MVLILRVPCLALILALCIASVSVRCQERELYAREGLVRLVRLNEAPLDVNSNRTPVVFWHGMGDTAKGSVSIDALALEKRYPGIQIYSIQIGKTSVADEVASYFSNLNQQVQEACEAILANDYIKKIGHLNGVGFSQGAQFLRAVVQRCPLKRNGILFKNLISLGGQHQGVYGLPDCNSPTLCDYIRRLLTLGAYEKEVQEHLVQAQYWHDPMNEKQYKERNIFLADINNERHVNQSYKLRLSRLDNFVLVKFEGDEMVVPPESSHFEFFVPNQKKDILPLEQSPIWLEDRLGLPSLKETDRLKFISLPGNHLQYKMPWFLSEIGDRYLDN